MAEQSQTSHLAHHETKPSVTSTSSRSNSKSLRPYALAVMAFRQDHKFQSRISTHHRRTITKVMQRAGGFDTPLNIVHAGISAVFSDSKAAVVAIAIRDSVYFVDFSVGHLDLDHWPDCSASEAVIAEYIITELRKYEQEHLCKFLSAGIAEPLLAKSPKLCSRLWLELDIVPLILHIGKGPQHDNIHGQKQWELKDIDEQADSMARKSIMYFGPNQAPILQVDSRGAVQIDAGHHAHMVTIEDYMKTVGVATWKSVTEYVTDLRKRKIRIAFFSATPQGGGVALMRHALVRFSKVMGVDVTWYVPKPKPGVFRITKTNHNILQGVASPDESLTEENKKSLTDWIRENAERYWLPAGGPLASVSEGGADVIVVDDPQMHGLIPVIKANSIHRPVIYRSHIEIRSDLVAKDGSPQSTAWGYMWNNVKMADMFISHPVRQFVPKNVPTTMIGYLPAATDWLDGLNKNLSEWDQGYYGHMFNVQCHEVRMAPLAYPSRQYIIQVARFDPSKGIPDVIKSYAKLRRDLLKDWATHETPQLLLCGHGSVDDPDGSVVYDQTMELLETHFPDLVSDVSVMRLGPSDQMLNTLLSKSYVALQLSTREGFEIKVSEALHKGKPVITTRAGGIPLQVQHNKNGFLVDIGDNDAVASHLCDLWTDRSLYDSMSKYALHSVSDEVSTVGNALSWFYLASELSKGKRLEPGCKWINDMAREGAGQPYGPDEHRLPREV